MTNNDNNIGDQIKSAIQNAIDKQDFTALGETVQKSIGIAAEGISQGISQIQENARVAHAEQQQRYQQHMASQQAAEMQRRQLDMVQYRYAKTGAIRAGGIVMGTAGALLAFSCFGSSALTGIWASLVGGMSASVLTAGTAVLLGFGVAGIVLLATGVRKASLAGRFKKYKKILGTREYCSIAELSQSTGQSEDSILKDLRKMISKGMFTQGHLSKDGTILMVTNDSYSQYLNALDAYAKREQERKLMQKVEKTDDAPAPLTPEQKSLLEIGNAYLAKIRASNRAIPDAIVTQKIDQIELVVNKIFEYAREHPAVIDDLQRLMDYYLPTTVKLLDAYADLDSQPVQGENIMASKREIENTLDTLSVAFERLLDSIFRDMTWDVSTDISVLHAVLAQEGLVNGAFDDKGNKDNKANKAKPSA